MADVVVRKRNGGEDLGSSVVRREADPLRLVREILGWDPFREITPLFSGGANAYAPAFEVKENSEAFVFKADLPGTRKSDLDVSVTGNRLTVSGKREAEKEEKEETYYANERSYGSFSRTFTLPDEVDTGSVTAELKSGELTVVVPKMPAAVAKKVLIVSGDRQKS